MAPIPTVYDGIEYRSRLEARWAAFMSNIGWEYVYEPFDGDGYIPDFIVHGEQPLFVEVKPAVTLAEFQQPTRKIERGLADYRHDVLIVGADPLPSISDSWGRDHPAAGLLAERIVEWCDICGDGNGADGLRLCPACAGVEHHVGGDLAKVATRRVNDFIWSTGHWLICGLCSQIGVFHNEQSYGGRPCGHSAGDHYMRSVPTRVLQSMWADACNSVKWRGRAA